MSTIRTQLELGPTPRVLKEAGPSPRDVQRDALRDLVALATESAATEAQIEQQFEASTEQARKEFEKAQWAVNQRYAGLQQSTTQQYETKVTEIKAYFRNAQEEAKEGLSQGRLKVDRDHEPVERKTRQQLDQAVWMAESVLEVAQNQVKEEAKKTAAIVQTNAESLDSIEQQALKLLKRYHQQPPPDDAAGKISPTSGQQEPDAEMAAQREEAERQLGVLRGLMLPGLFVGSWPWVGLFLLCVLAAVGAQVVKRTTVPQWQPIGIAVGGTFVVALVIGLLLRAMARSQVVEAYKPLRRAVGRSREAAKLYVEHASKRQSARLAEAVRSRDAEVKRMKAKAAPVLNALTQKRNLASQAADAEYAGNIARLKAEYEAARKAADQWLKDQQASIDQRKISDLAGAQQKYDSLTQGSRKLHDDARTELERRLREGLAHIQAPIGDKAAGNGQSGHDWSDPYWAKWAPPLKFPALVRFGDMRVDLRQIANGTKTDGHVRLELPDPFSMPAALAFPRGASLLIQHDRTGREKALHTLQTVMTQLLTSLPAGRARFTIIDPVGRGQNFAGFMHLADHDEALVGTRIWTETDQVEQRLADMTEHMETVIQKYLRNEYPTIDDYNAQAGELAEPYRFLVIADFPNAFETDSYQRLASIVSTGARCGVYVLIARDIRVSLPSEAQFDDIEAHCVNLVQQGDQLVWKDEVFGQFPLKIDPPPPEKVLTELLDRVGRSAKENKRVEVSFDTIAPTPNQFWTGDNTSELQVPVGRMGATRLQSLRLGKGVAQHVLIAGKTGSGKSTLLHAMITNLAMWYSPDQIELYLIDFKKGVEFKTYASHNLPHARAIAVESDREFGVSVLQRLDAELARRGEIFRKVGVQDLNSYRKSDGATPMPRTLLIIDEFQEFFTEDDKLAQEASLLLDRLVRQGRAFGVHVLLGSQTIGGTSGLGRSTIGQMGVRVALQTSEADSQLILGDNNSAARLLSRPGEAIYNDAGGLVEANSPFQVAWLADERRDQYLDAVTKLAAKGGIQPHDPPIVYEGNAPAEVQKNAKLQMLLDTKKWAPAPTAAQAWVGDPVAIKEPTAIIFRRQSGANILLVGQQEEQAMAVMISAMISLATQYPPGSAIFHILDGTPADSALAGNFEKVRAVLPQDARMVDYRVVPEMINELAQEVAKRQAGDPAGEPEIYVFIYGLQRYRMLRKAEDEFSFSTSDEEKKANPGKQFSDILREGPGLGVHVISWIDTVASLERTMDRTATREFDNRILFQMSAADSSNLIDSPAANKLGFFRAMAYSEEQGVIEKFRPYALPDAEWLARIARGLSQKLT
jgi:DNA segregation ATPase FtsK/SpoIIIE, S-DNA-T family